MEPSASVTVTSAGSRASKPMHRADLWIFAGIVGLAFVLRITALGIKPPHFDEGVNGWFVDQMTRQGFYHYDPSNFHGPLHFYLLFVAQTLLGRHIWVLRLPVALISTGCVAFVFAYRVYLGERVCQLAALAMAVSPGMVFYGRYAIHEPALLFFLMLTVWGGIRAAFQLNRRKQAAAEGTRFPETAGLVGSRGRPRTIALWCTGLGITGMILTKETYAIHLIALLLAFPALWLLERISPSAPDALEIPPYAVLGRRLEPVTGVCLALLLFFYTGGFLDWPSLGGLISAFAFWGTTGTGGNSGHEKPWYYWFELLLRYEWLGLLGLAGVVWLAWPKRDRLIRYLGIAGIGTLAAYSLIRYKTPWCIISIVWPFFFVAGSLIRVWAASIFRPARCYVRHGADLRRIAGLDLAAQFQELHG